MLNGKKSGGGGRSRKRHRDRGSNSRSESRLRSRSRSASRSESRSESRSSEKSRKKHSRYITDDGSDEEDDIAYAAADDEGGDIDSTGLDGNGGNSVDANGAEYITDDGGDEEDDFAYAAAADDDDDIDSNGLDGNGGDVKDALRRVRELATTYRSCNDNYHHQILKLSLKTKEDFYSFVEGIKLLSFECRRPPIVKDIRESMKGFFTCRMRCDNYGMEPSRESTSGEAKKQRRLISSRCNCEWEMHVTSQGITQKYAHHIRCKELYTNIDDYECSDHFNNLKLKCQVKKEGIVSRVVGMMEQDFGHSRHDTKTAVIMATGKAKLDSQLIGNIFLQAKNIFNGKVKEAHSLDELIKELLKMSYPHTIQRDDNDLIVGITWLIPRVNKYEKVCVMFCDVSHGFTHGHFGKWSFIFSVNPIGKPELLAVTGLHHESIRTFECEMRFLIETTGRECFENVVVLTDEDEGRITAIRNCLSTATIRLCFWHKLCNFSTQFNRRGNFKKNFRAMKAAKGDYNSLSKDELKELCKERRLLLGGNKQDLIHRLEECDSDKNDISLNSDDDHVCDVDDDAVDKEREGSSDSLFNFYESVCDFVTGFFSNTESGDIMPSASADSITTETNAAGNSKNSSSLSIIDFKTVNDLFKWVVSSSSRSQAEERLDQLCIWLPTHSAYINKQLRPNIEYWAAYSSSWILNYFLRTTGTQVSI